MTSALPPWTIHSLATAAGVNRNTVSTFLAGSSWPQPAKLAGIERALGLTPGTFDRVAAGTATGDTPDDTRGQTDHSPEDQARLDQLVVALAPDALRDLTDAEREEVIAAAKLAALRAIREARGG